MRNEREADKVLEMYARELMKNREADYDAFMGATAAEHLKISPKYMVKRCLIAAVILTLTFALAVISASALGINLFGFDLFQSETHTEFVPDGNAEGGKAYFRPGYIPEGYEAVESGSVNTEQKEYTYLNDKDEMLTVVESYAENPGINLNNEGCTYYKETVQGYEVHIYEYEYGYSSWLLQKKGTFIMIYGSLDKAEFEKIIVGLE